MIAYFAYGSNLWIDQMVARTGLLFGGADKPSIAQLPGYRLVFNMRAEDGQFYANIEPPGQCVQGVLYSCTPNALEKLDAFETGYHRVPIVVVGDTGTTVAAVTYRADVANVRDGGSPSDEYLQRILCGGRRQGLPESYLREIENLANLPRPVAK